MWLIDDRQWIRLGRWAVPSVGLVVPMRLAAGEFHDGESFRRAPAGALPPVAADSAAGDERDVAPVDGLVDVCVLGGRR